MKTSIQLIYNNNYRTVEVTLNGELTIDDLCEQFEYFLRGIGYGFHENCHIVYDETNYLTDEENTPETYKQEAGETIPSLQPDDQNAKEAASDLRGMR